MKKQSKKKTMLIREDKLTLTITGHIIEFRLEETVYLKTDKEQRPRYVTGIQLRPFNSVVYGITEGTNETWHYGFEINRERDIIMATSN